MNIKKDEETGDAKARLKRISSENNLQGVSKKNGTAIIFCRSFARFIA